MNSPSDIINLRIRRFEPRSDRTLGEVLIEYGAAPGVWEHFSWIVEDPDRMLRADQGPTHIAEVKVKGKTCIPSGRYKLAWTWSPSRKRNTLRLLDVPGFKGILIHTGNDPDDTEGCLCPGLDLNRVKGVTARSTPAVAWLEKHVPPLLEKRDIYVEVMRDYQAAA